MSAAESDKPLSSSPHSKPPAEPPHTPAQRTPSASNLQAQLSSAVRGAIADVMANQTPAVEMPELDLDFSLPPDPAAPQKPVLIAEPERALANVRPTPRGKPETNGGRLYILAPVMLAVAGLFLFVALTTETTPEQPPQAEPNRQIAPKPAIAPAAAEVAPTIETAKVARPPVPAPAPSTLDAARDLLQAGHVTAARKALMADGLADRPDAALLLARSFDPNYLATLPSSDAKPDIEAARRWYTHWYDIASKAGEVPTTMRLDLLLRSLNERAAVP